MQIIRHNKVAMFALEQLKITENNKTKNMEKLSSGYRINRAADDAAGLKISEKMRSQISGLNRAAQNIEEGICFIQTADGALNEVHAMLQRIRELAVQASNDTNMPEDRQAINDEVQQIKREMNRVYRTTEFNKNNIFKAPDHIELEINGEPNDFELFNGPDGVSPAGVIINNKRYTWGELGISETPIDEDYIRIVNDPDSPDEVIKLKVNAGDTPDKIRRIYEMTADETGIKINGLYSGLWGSTIVQSGNTYSWNYRGMELSFEEDDEFVNAIKKSEDILTDWETYLSGTTRNSAVTSSRDTMKMNVTNANKNDIANWSYQIKADEAGVGLIQTNGNDGLTHTKTGWADFGNVNGGEAYPIADWGTAYEGSNPVTVSSDATYRYQDAASAGFLTDGMKFDFSFYENEIAKAQAISGLTQNLTGSGVSSPISMVTSNAGATVTGYSGFNSFTFQRDELLRDFGDSGSSTAMQLTVDRTKVVDRTVDDHEYRLKLTEAYIKQVDNYTDITTTTYTEASVQFYNLDGDAVDNLEDAHFDTTAPTGTTSYGASGTNTYFIANTGQAANWSNITNSPLSSDTSSYTDATRREVRDGEGTLIGYAEITYNKTIETTRNTTSTYETNDWGSLNNYVQNGANYSKVSSSAAYYVLDEGSGNARDFSDRGYRALETGDGSAQRYIQNGDGYYRINVYNLSHYEYAGKNSNGGTIMTGANSGSFIDVANGSTTITITDANGHVNTYYTAEQYKSTTLRNNAYGTSLSLSYTSGSENRSNVITVTPNGAASRTFTKAQRTAGISSDSLLNTVINPPPIAEDKLLHIQAGANVWQSIDITYPCLSNSIIGISGAKTTTFDNSQSTIGMCDIAINKISGVRSLLGATQNRLEHAYNIAKNVEENTQAAESVIRDLDMADEVVEFSKNNILAEAGNAMLAQANQQPEAILRLLG